MSEKERTVLVTGGRGFIGRHMVACLKRHGYAVVSVDVMPGDSAEEIVADIREPDTMARLFAAHRFDLVIDLASYAEVGLPAAAYQCNVDMTRTMVEMVRAHDIAKYIFVSTQFVFRTPGRLPAGEEDFDPADNYGASKVRSEQLIRGGLPADKWLILRPTYVWGPGSKRFRDGLLYRLAKGQFLIPATGPGRFYAYVETLCEQTLRFAEMDFARLPGKVFYLTDAPVRLAAFCRPLVAALGQGRARAVPPAVIRLLGRIGGIAKRLGLPFPINPLQAKEMTGDYPVPYEQTLELTGCIVDPDQAAARTAQWALEDRGFVARLGR